MTIMALAEQIGRSVSEKADTVQMEKGEKKVTYTAVVGRQTFVITIEELAKDDQEPAIT